MTTPVPSAQSAAPTLGQGLRGRHVTMITIGGIIGAGLFVGSSTTIALVGPAAVFSYAIAGLLVMLVMRMISEMAAHIPGRHSFADFAREGLGDWAGFVSGWLYWYFWVVTVAIEAIAGAKILNLWLPMLPVWVIGVTLMTLMTAINLLSTRSYGEFEFWFSLIKVLAIAVFILFAGLWAAGLGHAGGATFGNWTAFGGFAPHGYARVLAAVCSTIFAMCGAEIATVAAIEARDSEQAIARLALTVALRILVFYVLAILMITAVVPWTAIHPGYSPFATALAAMRVPAGAIIMSAVVLVAVLSCLNSGLYVTSRTLFGLAAHGDAPGWLVAVNRRQVPARAIIAASLFSYGALAVERWSPGVVFSFLLNACGATMLLIYLMVAVAQLRLRARYGGAMNTGGTPRLKIWLHPWLTLLAIAAMLAVLVFMGLSRELASQLWTSLLVAAALVAIGRMLRTPARQPVAPRSI